MCHSRHIEHWVNNFFFPEFYRNDFGEHHEIEDVTERRSKEKEKKNPFTLMFSFNLVLPQPKRGKRQLSFELASDDSDR